MAALAAGCGDEPPLTTIDFHVTGPPAAVAGGCPLLSDPIAPALPGADRIRLTYRGAGGGPLVCDAVLPLDGARRAVAIPDAAAAGPVDVWIEYIVGQDAAATRLGAGVARAVDLTAGGAIDLRVWPTHAFACAGALQVTARAFHSATLLPTGAVLLVGGVVADPAGASDVLVRGTGPNERRLLFASAAVELFDPVRGRTSLISAPALRPRAFHQAVLLSTDPIRVAVYGGLTVNGDATQAAVAVEGIAGEPLRLMPGNQAISAPTEILTFDPASTTVTVEAVDDSTARGLFSAAAPDGPLGAMPPVVAGGWTDATAASVLQRADVLDPAALTPTGMASLGSPHVGATLTPLDGDAALIWGGHIPPLVTPPSPAGELLVALATAPAAQAITLDGASAAPSQRAFHAAARAGDGSVVVVGGFAIDAAGALVPDPVFAQRIRIEATVLVSDLAVTSDTAPAGHPAALALADGDLLVSGGTPVSGADSCLPGDPGLGCAVAASYLYRNASADLESTGALIRARYGHRTTLLTDGTVLVTGGLGPAEALEVIDDAEIYDPRTADPLADLAPDVVRAPGDVARDASDLPLAACPIIEIAPAP